MIKSIKYTGILIKYIQCLVKEERVMPVGWIGAKRGWKSMKDVAGNINRGSKGQRCEVSKKYRESASHSQWLRWVKAIARYVEQGTGYGRLQVLCSGVWAQFGRDWGITENLSLGDDIIRSLFLKDHFHIGLGCYFGWVGERRQVMWSYL